MRAANRAGASPLPGQRLLSPGPALQRGQRRDASDSSDVEVNLDGELGTIRGFQDGHGQGDAGVNAQDERIMLEAAHWDHRWPSRAGKHCDTVYKLRPSRHQSARQWPVLDDVQKGKKPKAFNIIIKDKPTKNLREKILHKPNDAPHADGRQARLRDYPMTRITACETACKQAQGRRAVPIEPMLDNAHQGKKAKAINIVVKEQPTNVRRGRPGRQNGCREVSHFGSSTR